MQEKRQRILKMLESGTISMDEALTLLENLHENHLEENQIEPVVEIKKEAPKELVPTTLEKEQQHKKSTVEEEEPSVDDFLNNLRKDFTDVSDQFMQFMQTAVQKVKGFDFEVPFGQSMVFNHTMTKPAEGIEEVLVQLKNGKLAIHSSDEQDIRAEFTVKSYNQDSEEAAKKHFLEKMFVNVENGKLNISSEMKITHVGLDLYIPHKVYKRLAVKLTNGSFKMKDTQFNDVQVKTANGKIEVSQLIFKESDFEASNGTIYLKNLIGDSIEAETLNGRIYIDGRLKEIEAQSLNGHVTVTTTSEEAEKIEAKTMSGTVELYIPSTISLSGELSSSVGKLDLGLEDVERISEQDQIFQRTIRFKKDVPNQSSTLHLMGDAKSGTVLVRYNI